MLREAAFQDWFFFLLLLFLAAAAVVVVIVVVVVVSDLYFPFVARTTTDRSRYSYRVTFLFIQQFIHYIEVIDDIVHNFSLT